MSDYRRLTDKDIDQETRKKLCIVLCDIRRRCLNPDYKYYYLYGERGISVCDEWQGKEGHKNFREWAVNNGYKKGLSIDRIDNNKGYSPDNCRWATAKEQSYNRRSNKLITIQGKTQTVTEWAEEIGISIGALQNRLRYGWEEDRLLEPTQVHLKMSKHEMRVEILKLRKQVEEYQSKIENGTLIELPCKVGTTIYHLYQASDVITEDKVFNYHFGICSKFCVSFENLFWYGTKKRVDIILVEHFGKYWFTNKAEAEAKLRELKESKNG